MNKAKYEITGPNKTMGTTQYIDTSESKDKLQRKTMFNHFEPKNEGILVA